MLHVPELHHLPKPQELPLHTQPTLAPPQSGVVPEHVTQFGPHLETVSQAVHTPMLHHLPEPQEVPLHTQLPPLQSGVVPEHTVQFEPQWAGSELVQFWHAEPSQYLPLPHEPLGAGVVLHTQLPLGHNGVVPEHVAQLDPQCAGMFPQAVHDVPLQYFPLPHEPLMVFGVVVLHIQLPLGQSGLVPEHVAQLDPQCAGMFPQAAHNVPSQ